MRTVDERCDMELDETDPAVWLKLEAATEEYIQKNCQSFKNLCERLLVRFKNEEKNFEHLKTYRSSKLNHSHAGSMFSLSFFSFISGFFFNLLVVKTRALCFNWHLLRISIFLHSQVQDLMTALH